jgi:SpoVK/Ycf46/Vps4 family AAA+-type ATPase
MVLSDEVRTRLQRIIREQLEIERLAAHDLEPRRKFLLIGPPGTGKTMTASVLAGELNLPLFVIRLDGIITKFMGETSAKLRLVFDAIRKQRGVYLFDEFDSIGSMRAAGNDVGEVRRILNSYLQFIDQDTSASLILSATNHPDILDYALFRRFDDVIEYNLPSVSECEALLKNRMATGKPSRMPWKTLSRESDGLSHAEITRAVDDALKETIINKKTSIGKDTVLQMIRERQTYHAKIFKNPSSIHRMRS